MGINLTKGQKIDLTKGDPSLSKILVGLGWDTNKFSNGADFDLDAAVFMLRENKKVGDNKDFIYYGNLKHSSGSVEHMGDNLTGGNVGDDEQIKIDLARVPAEIDRIAITVTIYDAEARRQNFGQVSNAYIRIVDEKKNSEILRFELNEDFSVETSVVIAEIYRYKGEWKFNAVAGGFKGGLKALCMEYGLNMEISDPARGAVVLEKGQKINLRKSGNSVGEVLINLNWSQPQRPQGLFNSLFANNAIDLDLGCLYELENGRKGAVQALGNSFGSLTDQPYVSLDGDDRTGASTDGENLRINGSMIPKIKRILVYTFIYEGAANWREAQGIVTVKCPGNQDIIVKMDEYGSNQTMCAIALLENKGGDTLSIEKVVRFFRGHQDMDRAFNWGLRWVKGSKD